MMMDDGDGFDDDDDDGGGSHGHGVDDVYDDGDGCGGDDGGGALRLPPLARAAAQLLLHHLDELRRHAGPARVNAYAADSSPPGAGTSFGRLVVKGGEQERCIGAPRGAAGPRRCCA